MHPLPRLLVPLLLLAPLALAPAARAAAPSFVTFESGPVRPLALSPDGSLLFACNIPDARLEIFAVGAEGLTHAGSVPVGLEPVAMAARSDGEVWVVNHLSDSVSVVDVPGRRVVRTLLVGDEPRDLVFAGPDRSRAFVTTAHRGQHRTHPSIAAVPGASDPQLTTPGVPRADVWVFDATDPGPGVGGTPLRIVSLFGDTPRGLAVSPDGSRVYVGIFHLSAGHLRVPSGGPAGLALDEARGRLYVATRFDNGVSVIDLASRRERQRHRLHNPEPDHVVAGRRFLYDARFSSANGEASCASCHVFGDFDSLAWDLGNPDDPVTSNPIPIEIEFAGNAFQPPINGTGNTRDFHPMKGPMTTQTLRGMARSGAMHWRGDRATGPFGTDAFDEALSFNNFIVAFEGLLGRATEPSHDEMQAFTDFALAIALPPNPVRTLDNQLTAAQQAGRDFYFGPVSDVVFNCNGCHTLDPANGFFGTNGRASFENETQIVKVPHLRNAYQKVGMFGMMDVAFVQGGDNGHQGEQVRGFGFLDDGSIDTLFRFFRATVFTFAGGDPLRRQVEAFMLAFDSDLAPIVGQQVTRTATNASAVDPRIDLLLARAAAPFDSALLGGASRECDVVVKGTVAGEPRGWLYQPGAAQFQPDRAGEPPLARAALLALAESAGQELTFTAVPTGSGPRAGIDRDLDGVLDGDDNCPFVANPGQADADQDGTGDACAALSVPEPAGGAAALAAAAALLAARSRRRRGAERASALTNDRIGRH